MEKDSVNALLMRKRMDRSIATVLGYKDEFIDPALDDPLLSKQLRNVILDQFNNFHEFCMDLMGTLDSQMIANDLYIERLEDELDNAPEGLYVSKE